MPQHKRIYGIVIKPTAIVITQEVLDRAGVKIVLASASPRRQQLLSELGIRFEVRLKKTTENYDPSMPSNEVAAHIAMQKNMAFSDEELASSELLITADTIVACKGKVLGKPHDVADAVAMLHRLSGRCHEVYTGLCLRMKGNEVLTHTEETRVYFKSLSDEEIEYYVSTYKPCDKAGAYGIQEWIGFVGIERIEGCYYNVMGLPLFQLSQQIESYLNRHTPRFL